MTALGVFRDDYYNAISVLPQSQFNASVQNGGTISASLLAGAGDCYASFSGNAGAQALTTDTAVNIIAQIQNAVATAYKQGLGSFAAGVNPPPGVPNLFNMVYTLTVLNFNTAAGAITLTGGTGVTITGTNTIAITSERIFVVTVTSPTTVSFQSVNSGTIAA
jgi:phage-related minor tail protein